MGCPSGRRGCAFGQPAASGGRRGAGRNPEGGRLGAHLLLVGEGEGGQALSAYPIGIVWCEGLRRTWSAFVSIGEHNEEGQLVVG